ncbi:hypothetical protein NDU88_003779 [Pleurodeles waltl]|uniref:Ig-like domain-containing protein n=1 Tax=Pleurodeles waltl TaxID=8319 RepID=A0AAV7QB08_PLEWA|nr:hypothetical protein NDU88_003779 [Pleurodeles waltl]
MERRGCPGSGLLADLKEERNTKEISADTEAYAEYWTTEPVAAPQVFPMVSSTRETRSVGCLVSGYFPEPISVVWKEGSSIIPSKDSSSVLQSSSGVYVSNSLINVSRQELQSGDFSCTVKHAATNSTIVKRVSVGSASLSSVSVATMTVKLVQASCPESDGNQDVSLVCYVTSSPSSSVQIGWREDDNEVSLLPTSFPATQAGDGTYSLSFSVRVPQAKWNKGAAYSCYTTDPRTKEEVSSVLTRRSGAFNCLGIVVSLYRPTAEDVLINKKAVITCRAINLPASTGAVFTWTREMGNCTVESVTENPELTSSGLYSVSSRLSVCAEEWVKGERFTCRMEYPGLTEPIVKTISKDLDVLVKPPSVYVNGPPTEELARNEKATLICMIKGFSPADLSIKWLQAGQEMDSGAYDTTIPQAMKEAEGYFAVSTLQIDAEDWKKGGPFTCVVVHEGAPQNVMQRSIDKYSGKPTAVNVSVNMLDSTSSCY